MARTESARYAFAVKECGDGTHFIGFELRSSPDLAVLGNGILSLHLARGTTYAQAEELADLLNRRVDSVAFTDLDQG